MNQKNIQFFYTLLLINSYTMYGMEASSSSSLIAHARQQGVASPLDIVIASQGQNRETAYPLSPRSQEAENPQAITQIDQENTPSRPRTKIAKASRPPLPGKLRPLPRRTMPSQSEMDILHSYAYDIALYSDNMVGGSQEERDAVLSKYYLQYSIIPNKGKSCFELQEQIERRKNNPSKTLENIVYKALQTDAYESKKTFACQCDLGEDCECILEEITCTTVTIDQVRALLKTTPSNRLPGYKKLPMLSTFYSSPY